MYNVLLVEDSADYQFLVPKCLGPQFHVTVAADLAHARVLLDSPNFDLVLLDLQLPDGDGYGFCAELQSRLETRDIPVVILTGRGEVNDRVLGWTTGADDYIVKPFNPLEFQTRILARMTKAKARAERELIVNWGDLILNLSFHECKVIENGDERPLYLTAHEFKILYCLLKSPQRVFSREQLISRVWGLNIHITERTVDKHISSLRQKLGEKRNYIRTIAGIGYRVDAAA